MKRKHIIEFVVAAVVIIVLFIAVFPSFQKAQRAASTTKSLRDLSDIAKAIETYNQGAGGKSKEVHSFSIKDQGKNVEPGVWAYTVREFGNHYMEYREQISNPFTQNFATIKDSILSQVKSDYRPTESMLLLNDHVFKNSYVVETGVWRKLCIQAGYQPNHYYVSMNRLETFPFDNDAKLPYVGVARGPFYDAHIGEKPYAAPETRYSVGAFRPSSLSRIASDAHFVEYDPTNGVKSHGYTVYRSPAGPVAAITDYIKVQQRLPLPYAPKASTKKIQNSTN